MVIASLTNVSISFGADPVLDGVELLVRDGDRACLVGRNGEGKSTLLRLLSGELTPDEGAVTLPAGSRVAYLPQNVPHELRGPVRDIVTRSVAAVVGPAATSAGPPAIERALSLVKLCGDERFEALSGGLKRRALLAAALACTPDLLLLDEPTNHLDIDSIEWLEGFLKRGKQTFLFVTHDRMFLRRLATRIIDLDRGRLNGWTCDYDTFLRRKGELLNDEAAQNARLDKKLSREEVWIRQGIKARRTRDEGRVRALMELRHLRAARRTIAGPANLRLQEAGASGNVVVKAKGVTFAYGSAPVVRDVTTTILRGDRVGIIGPNGCGKTTLLRLLLGPHAKGADEATPERIDHRFSAVEATDKRSRGLQPQAGTIKRGTRLEVAYFDQHRAVLDRDASVFDNIAGGADTICIDGRSRNVYGYLQEFMFAPDRARSPVSTLSGGERNRLLLAKLFSRPANLLVMDEPTNDLDTETLDLLEERLVAFNGTLLLVSHDREFLNNVVTSTLVFEGDGRVAEYVGGYDDWVRQRRSPPTAARPVPPRRARPRVRKLTYREGMELAELPQRIERVETEQAELQAVVSAPAFYRRSREEITGSFERLTALDADLAQAYVRWEELEAIKRAAARDVRDERTA